MSSTVMKTLEIVDKYQKLVGGLLGIPPANVEFRVRPEGNYATAVKVIGKEYQLDDDKPDIERQQWCHGHYEVWNTAAGPLKPLGQRLGSFKLYMLPHCCGVIVSCNACVETAFRGKRVGTTLNMLRQDIARALGYTVMICTDVAGNTPQRKLLATNGWKDLMKFTNKRTGNEVYIAAITL
jgi:hypothetical protein